ncbi:hypothetical protein E3G52_000389 [Mycobacteroides abscessus]|uniref:TPR repeat region-containing protein n=1 Tax=Mycobacteroides abscessus TaxID=36809 RepID=UPI00187834F8|nr:hypothetical protein [Mycobacteroides abscessus]MBE5453525.1 hypothetical protein [Mycobacteroides abscessus]
MSGRSLHLLLSTDPENSMMGVRLAMEALTEIQQDGQHYKQAINHPGGSDWQGKAADAAQETADADEKMLHAATRDAHKAASEALHTLAYVKERHSAAVQIHDDMTSNGYSVAEDLTVKWIVPPGAKPNAIADGERVAARVTKELQAAYDKWFGAEQEAQTEIRAAASELSTSYNPIGGLTAADGRYDGAYLQGGTQWEPDVLARVQAASTLDDGQLQTLAAGGKIDIGANRMQYLYQLAHSFDGKSEAEIAAIKSSLPPAQQTALTRALALAANDRVTSGVNNASGVTDATRKNFIPAAGSLANLPDSVRETLTRPDRVGSGPLGVGPAADKAGLPNIELRGVGQMQDVAKIFGGAGGYLNGSEAGRAMLDANTEYTNTDIDSKTGQHPMHLTSDAHGDLTGALADIYQSGAQDHVAVHDIVTGEPTEGEKFIRGITGENWGDQSGKVDDTIQWAGDHSKEGAEVANKLGHYMADHKPELQDMAGGGNFAQNNPEMAGTAARVEGEYLGQFADSDPGHRHDPGIEPFKSADQFRDMVSTFDQGRYSGEIINEQAQAQHQQLLNDAVKYGSDFDLNAAGRLAQGMTDGAVDSVADHPDPASLKAVKDVAGWVPNVDKIFTVDDIVKQLQNQGAKLPDGFAQNLAQAGGAGNITAYQTSVLDALVQAHPGIAHDPLVGQYINGGHFDPTTVDTQDKAATAQTALSRWFKEVAPRDYNFNMAQWDDQIHQGSTHRNWEWKPGR